MRARSRLAAAAVVVAFAAVLVNPCPAARKVAMSIPDLARGEPVPAEADHDWTLGATVARGWMFSDKLTTTDARQIAVTEVAKGSPADGVLAKGDTDLPS
jgi:hypothetical protein